jgi:enoyl-CoA hydratase/carnithine racemase
MTANEPRVLRSDKDGIVTLTLNRPQQRNALDRVTIAELHAALNAVADDPAARVVVLAANGPAFCSGHDLKELRGNTEPVFYDAIFSACSNLMMALVKLPKPVIARVHGTATAAGAQLVASCDLAVAADTARFATPGVDIGLFCSTPMVAISRNIPRKRVMEMLLTGEMVDAATAAQLGLINRAVPADRLDAEVLRLATLIAGKSALTLRIGKEAFYRQLELSQPDAYTLVNAVMTRNMATRDAAEGIDAFLAKRHPSWSDA